MGVRIARAVLVAVLPVALLVGCDGPPVTNAAVLTINDSRDRYLDAMCPLLADDAFWTPVEGEGAAETAAGQLATADPAIARLADTPRPYPRLLRPSMTRLVAVLQGNQAYFAAAATASPAALARLDPPSAVPEALLGEVQSYVTVNAAPGSPNCTGHLPTPTPTPS